MFKPWVGPTYGEPSNFLGGVRLLVLGESHYCNENELEKVGTCDPGFTQMVVNMHAFKRGAPFFTKLTQVVAGQTWGEIETVRSLWNSIAFYNYVPVFVATRPQVRPKDEMFRAGREPFQDVLRDLEPEAILVTGYELWNWLIWGLPEGKGTKPWTMPFHEIGTATAGRMKHCSAGFSWAKERPVVEEILQRARMRRGIEPTD